MVYPSIIPMTLASPITSTLLNRALPSLDLVEIVDLSCTKLLLFLESTDPNKRTFRSVLREEYTPSPYTDWEFQYQSTYNQHQFAGSLKHFQDYRFPGLVFVIGFNF